VFQTATQWLMAPSWPIYFALAVFAPMFLRIYPARYEAGQGVLLVLSLVLLLAMATGPVNITLVMGGKSGWTLLNSAAGLALNLVLNIVLIPRYGIIGAAYAWAAAIAFTQVTQLIMVRIFLKLNPFGPGALMIAAVSAAIFGGLGLLTRFTLGVSIPAFLLYAVVSTPLYALFIWRFRRQLRLNEIFRALKGRGIRRMGRDWHPA
jgi:O-antigen/teichoic acid export membrane protein